MVLYSERKRLAEIAAREAAGESFWTAQVPADARIKIAHAYDHLCKAFEFHGIPSWASAIWYRELGYDEFTVRYKQLRDMRDTGMFLSFIEAAHAVVMQIDEGAAEDFADEVNRVFAAHRVSYKFIHEGSQAIDLDSEELHIEVLEPAIKLLYGDKRLDKAQSAYMSSLKQISQHEPGNAITDAGTALQEALAALGADGPTIGEQLKVARRIALVPGRDNALLESVEKVVNWVASERNQNSDAHKVTDATLDDAWLIVHVVGALIVRLAGAPRA